MFARGALRATEHSCELGDPCRTIELGDFDLHAGAAYRPLIVPAGSDLREMGDAKDLALLAELAHRLANRFGDRAADADVDLVEDERADRRAAGGDELDCEADARELAARGDLGEGAQREARVRGDLELDFFASPRGGFRFPQGNRKTPAGHGELLHSARHRLR